jgi:hypothetical protein
VKTPKHFPPNSNYLEVAAMDKSKLKADLNRTRVEFLLTELELAFTFAAVAETSANAETRKRNRDNARKTFRSISKLLALCSPDDSQRAEINGKLRELQHRLELFGEPELA